ncbi:O-acetylhomoserine aminocarboxypropyltransferase/cysteine synthase family protein [Kocuria massiliensis]|uniref:O-acetylhomoserine aminocarboxypropyltransferase/cysteine synthase family protein n=1 Tax=Kocuria massiliensis TaxID=1926282 RepID=UPI0022B9AA10|nr:PLP-dependent transferase [Kocuria massiliensis]
MMSAETNPTAPGIGTVQVHGGTANPPAAHPVHPPLYLTASYSFGSLAEARECFAQRQPGFTYSRTGSPTVGLLERRLAELEGGVGAVATASGQAAISLALLALAGRSGQSPDGEPHPDVDPGHVVASNRIYGGTADLLNDTLAEAGIGVTWVSPHRPEEWARAVTPRARAFLVESIGNPHADLPDLPALAEIAHASGAVLIVDNTLATPYLLRPGLLGADVVVHSVTKYLTGNGTALAGVVVDTGRFNPSLDADRWPQFTVPRRRFGNQSLVAARGEHGAFLHLVRAQLLNDLGPSLAPWNAQQALEGIETLDVRVRRHCEVAEEIASRLQGHPRVAAVRHPSLPGSPDAAIARRDFPRGTGAILSFELDGTTREVEQFFDALRLFTIAVNLGDGRSMISHPAWTTHCRLTPELKAAGGITDQTVRLALGREDVDDLWADLAQALDSVGAPQTAAAANQDATAQHHVTERKEAARA